MKRLCITHLNIFDPDCGACLYDYKRIFYRTLPLASAAGGAALCFQAPASPQLFPVAPDWFTG